MVLNNTVEFVPNNVNTYHVLAIPLESPYDGSRSLITEPWLDNTAASPNGWHTVDSNDYTATRGNNVDAYEDTNHTNSPTGGDAARAEGGVDLEFDFPWDSTGSPSSYIPAAITNLFYWNNIIHDIMYNYGFDEASGNFQSENYDADDNGTDYVRAEAQDGNGNCNANFSTPPDGSRPRMQMYNCNNLRDSDFDNGVIAHEYGHGISNRLTGGASNTSCLSNAEQMGEGWSDFLAVIMTMKSGDQDVDERAIGNWFFNKGPNGGGIRPYPYSTDMAVNPMTYETISTVSVLHGLGSVWCTMIWDLNWAMIDEHGWDADLYSGTGGNNKTLQLVMEGLKLQPCSPGFVDGRDAILAADELLYNGDHKDLIWAVFANRGLGYSADQGSSFTVGDEVEAFDLPPNQAVNMFKIADRDRTVKGDTITYYVEIHNTSSAFIQDIVLTDPIIDSIQFISGNYGAYLMADTVRWPLFDLVADQSVNYQFTAIVDTLMNTNVPDFVDDIENGATKWNPNDYGSTSWDIQDSQSNSATHAWFANDGNSPGIANLNIDLSQGLTTGSELTFSHYYNTENNWDGGLVFISTDNGVTWIDLEPYFTQNGYNGTIYNYKPGFSGNSGGFITSIVDLNEFNGQLVKIRFQMNCDQSVGGLGWYIDDISISNLARYIPNTIYLTDEVISSSASLEYPTLVLDSLDLFFNADNYCSNPFDIRVDVEVFNADGPFTYLWSNGFTTKNISHLSPGTYHVTVSDGYSVGIDSIHILPRPFIVNTVDDYALNSLRSVINNTCANDTVFFDAGLLGDTIQLQEQILLNNNITIFGLDQDQFFIDISLIDRVFQITSGTEINISGLQLLNSQRNPDGGAIYNNGDLLLKDVKFINNKEGQLFIPLSNNGTITIRNTVEMDK